MAAGEVAPGSKELSVRPNTPRAIFDAVPKDV